MDFDKLKKVLAAQAKKDGICKEWHKKILTAPSREYLMELFIKGLDFTIKNNYPIEEFAAEFADIAPHAGIFINRPITDGHAYKTVVAKNAAGRVTFGAFQVAEVYALAGAEVEIEASGRAIIHVTAEPGSKVKIIARDWAKVSISRHGGDVQTETHDQARIK